MHRRTLLASALLLLAASVQAQAPLLSTERPTLVLTIVVDQMRYDYMTRFNADFDGGLKRLIEEGAVFTDANYEAAPTVTAVGHSTILSGATPSVSGIADNTWYERSEGKNVQSITDEMVTLLGGYVQTSPDEAVTPPGGGIGASPKTMLGSTIDAQ